MQLPAVAEHDFTDVQIFSRSLAIEAAEHTFATALNFAVFGGECIALCHCCCVAASAIQLRHALALLQAG